MTDNKTMVQIELNRIIDERDNFISSIDAELNPIVDRMNTQTATPADIDRYNELITIRKTDIKKAKDAWNETFNDAVTPVTGLKVGDRAEYICQSVFLSFDRMVGIVTKYRGQIQIKLDEKRGGRRYADIHTGWHKITEE